MKNIKGCIKNLKQTTFGQFCENNDILKRNKILFCTREPLIKFGIIGYIVPKGNMFKTNLPILEVDSDIPFTNGDIINLQTDGTSNVVWEADTPHHALYVTDICNSKCIMCPQIDGASSRYDECLEILDLINIKKLDNIGITGGEPTININKLIEVLTKISKKAPNIKVHILTNGRTFANEDVVKRLSELKNINLSFGIPLYSDVAEEHDYIVGVKGAFNETLQGLYNLGRYHQNIEIRTVILKQNYKKLRDLATFIYRNIPFVSHVALMGMEYHGNAKTNYDLISIDPIDYKQELFEAIREYVRYDMIVDVYNIPLCLADDRIKDFCRDSISTWKKSYLPQCESCSCKVECCGVFETSFKHSKNIMPI